MSSVPQEVIIIRSETLQYPSGLQAAQYYTQCHVPSVQVSPLVQNCGLEPASGTKDSF